ncbi:aquaporin [Flavobacterium piscinae]|uniref:aquaporin n=1 Tax=Flavobacterium piscinae TaxID=2506424 RepID=UPI002AAB19CD|nr:aquaporin [Flavobacterium piscinae]
MKKLFAEFLEPIGWFSAVVEVLYLQRGIPNLGIGFAGVALAFGLTVLTMAYAVGHISGGHFNPAVSFGLWAGGRFDAKELVPYIISQCIGALAYRRYSLFHHEWTRQLLRNRQYKGRSFRFEWFWSFFTFRLFNGQPHLLPNLF